MPETTLICGTHHRKAEMFWADNPGEWRFRHVGNGDNAVCHTQRFTARREWKLNRAGAITLLAGEDESS